MDGGSLPVKQPAGRYVIFRCLGHASCCHESMIGRMFLFVKSGYGWETVDSAESRNVLRRGGGVSWDGASVGALSPVIVQS